MLGFGCFAPFGTSKTMGSNLTKDDFDRISDDREMSLGMTTEQKRQLYEDRDFVTLEKIPKWSDYFSADSKSLESEAPSEEQLKNAMLDGSEIEVDKELNEKVSLLEGDITLLEIDGIVNAANKSLLGGGGIDFAIHRAAGEQLVQECRTLGGCETGDAKTTAGYNLPARYVIHTVGPMWMDPGALGECYSSCLREMHEHNMKSVAFCCISTGIYGYPNEKAALVALKTVREHLAAMKSSGTLSTVERIIFCLFLPIDVKIYRSWMQVYFPVEHTTEAGDTEKCPESDDKSSKDDADADAKADADVDADADDDAYDYAYDDADDDGDDDDDDDDDEHAELENTLG